MYRYLILLLVSAIEIPYIIAAYRIAKRDMTISRNEKSSAFYNYAPEKLTILAIMIALAQAIYFGFGIFILFSTILDTFQNIPLNIMFNRKTIFRIFSPILVLQPLYIIFKDRKKYNQKNKNKY